MTVTIFSRKNRKVTLPEGDSFLLPSDRTMLGMVGNNSTGLFQNGADFRDDYYVYVNGVRIGKWFIRVGGVERIWSPGLEPENLPKIDALYIRYLNKFEAINNRIFDIVKLIAKSSYKHPGKRREEKIAYAKPTHQFTSGSGEDEEFVYWMYEVGKSGDSYSFEWVKKPKKLVNFKLGQRLYELDRYSQSLGHRLNVVGAALEECLQRKLATVEKKRGLVVKIPVNGRDYWYQCAPHKHSSSYLLWSKIVWPIEASVVLT